MMSGLGGATEDKNITLLREFTWPEEYRIQKLIVYAPEVRTCASKRKCQLSGVGKVQKGSTIRFKRSQSVILGIGR